MIPAGAVLAAGGDHRHRPVECKKRHFRSCRVARFSLLNPARGHGAILTNHRGLCLEHAPEHGRWYPHRLRAIGHLVEAEDESQEWPELHGAIRDARQVFQHTGAMPDFTEIAALVHGVHAAV